MKLNASARIQQVRAASQHPAFNKELEAIEDALENAGIETDQVTDPHGKKLSVGNREADKVTQVLKSIGFTRVGLPKDKAFVKKKVGYNVDVSCSNTRSGYEIYVTIRHD